MHSLELELPRHLYTETRDSEGNITDVIYAADKLVSWSEYGGGNTIDRWCREKFEREIEAIDTWEDNRFLVLEERWLEEENGHDDAVAEARYERDCQVITAAAEEKRAAALNRMEARKAAIEKLVAESRAHLAAQQPAEPVDYTFEVLVAIGAVIAVYLLLN